MMNLRGGGVGFRSSPRISSGSSWEFIRQYSLSPDFQLWSENIEATGVGMFFSSLGFCFGFGDNTEKMGDNRLSDILMMLLGIRSFPWLGSRFWSWRVFDGPGNWLSTLHLCVVSYSLN